MAARYATRFRERERRRDIVPLGGGEGEGEQEGGRWLLQYEANGWATDFLSAAPANRVALRTEGVITEFAIDDFFYTIGTTHTVYDEAGVLIWSAHNLSRWSQDFDNAYWTKQANVTVTPNAAAAPDGSLTADQIDWGSAATFNGLFNATQTSGVIGSYWTYGLWIRSASGSGDIQLTDAAATAGITTATIDTNWKFVTLTEVKSNTNWSMWLRRTTDSPARIYVWGAQSNRGTKATAYLPTTTNARYGMALDYHPSTHQARGLLHEPQRTNLVRESAGGRPGFLWVAAAGGTGATLVGGQPDPGGGMHALQVTTLAQTGINVSAAPSPAVVSGTIYTASCWCKGPAGAQIYFVMDSATVAGTQKLITFTGAWQRVNHTYTATFNGPAYLGFETYNRSGGAHLPFGTFHIFGGQYEAATAFDAEPTSYIPTVGATVTRQVDWVIVEPGQINYSATAGNWWAETELLAVVAPGADRIIAYSTNWTPIYLGSGSFLSYDGPTISLATPNLGKIRSANTFQANDRALTANGLQPKKDATAGINFGSPGADIHIGNTPSMVSPIHGYIRRLRYLPRRVSDLELSLSTSADTPVAGGAADMLAAETAGWAGDFTHATDAYRLAVKSGGKLAYSGLSFFTQAGTSSKWVTNAAGTVVNVPAGSIALDYHPVTHAARGILSELQATNRALQSAMGRPGFLWTGNGSTFSTSAQMDPAGTFEAIQVVTNTPGAGLNVAQLQNLLTPGTNYTGSMWLKGTPGQQIFFNANANLAASQVLVTFTGAWQRVVSTFTAPNDIAYFACECDDRGAGPNLPNVTFHAWGAQFEVGTAATSYIPTLAAAVTRAPDNISGVIPPGMTGSEYSFFIRWNTIDPVPNARYPLVLTETSTGHKEVVGWADNGAPRGNVVHEFVTVAQMWPGPQTTPGIPVSNAIRVRANDVGGAMNGGLGTVDTDTAGGVPGPLTRAHFGGNGVWGGTALGSYHVQKFMLVPRAWDNAELVAKSNLT